MDEDHEVKNLEFNYFIAEQPPYCVVALIGKMDKDSKEKISDCLNQVAEINCKYFIFNFRDIITLEQNCHRDIVQMQLSVRQQKNGQVRNCGIIPKYKKEMLDLGTLKAEECVNNLKDAIVQLKKLANVSSK